MAGEFRELAQQIAHSHHDEVDRQAEAIERFAEALVRATWEHVVKKHYWDLDAEIHFCDLAPDCLADIARRVKELLG